ncbi:MAG: FtsB family cell division protein [Filifactoraceae bacterium]
MNFKYDDYKTKVKDLIEENNFEADISVNWKIVGIVSLIAGTFLFFGIMFANNLVDYKKVINERNNIIKEIQYVEEDIKAIKAQQEKSENLEFIEKQAREKLKMVKSNEVVYIDISE